MLIGGDFAGSLRKEVVDGMGKIWNIEVEVTQSRKGGGKKT